MDSVRLTDKHAVEAVLRRNTALHIYELGDLDDFFWPHTTWYGLGSGPDIRQVALVYAALDLPVLLAFSDEPDELAALLHLLSPLLPRRVYAHLSPNAAPVLSGDFAIEPHGHHRKLLLRDSSNLQSIPTDDVVPLSSADAAELAQFYRESYPDNWFDPRMLDTGCYFATRDKGRLASVAGVHVYSAQYRVAALGNVTTLPALRGRGLATRTTARLCKHLLATADHIGLNVATDNAPALACYRRLGFSPVAEYDELLLTRTR